MTNIVTRTAARRMAAALLFCSIATPVLAGNGYWYGNRSHFWNDGILGNSSNWYTRDGLTPLNPPTDTAIFDRGATIWIAKDTIVKAMLFRYQLAKPTLSIESGRTLLITGKGILDKGGYPAEFNLDPEAVLRFRGSARIGPSNRHAPLFHGSARSKMRFSGRTDGGGAVVANNCVPGPRCSIFFTDRSSAGRMTITNGWLSATTFLGSSTGGDATITTNEGGQLEFDSRGPDGTGPTVGKIYMAGATLKEFKPPRMTLTGNLKVLRLLDLHLKGYERGGVLVMRMKSRIDVVKHAHLGGMLQIVSSKPLLKKKYILIKADSMTGSMTGAFDKVRFIGSAFNNRKPRINYNGTEVALLLD